MRKSSSPSLGNCNSDIANKIFGIALDELQQEGHPDNEVPFIVRHIVDYIEEHGGLEQEGLFQVNGNAETVEWLRRRYDNGEEVDLVKEADVPSAISLLRYFLQKLPEPVIPACLHIHLMQLSQDYNNEDEFGRKLKYIMLQLPPLNFSLLKFLCRFLANVASHHEEVWSASALASVFGPDVFHIYTDVEDMREQETVNRIMAVLLENYYEFFEMEEDFSSTNDLSSITEQINDLLGEEEEEDEKLEPSEELPEDTIEKSDDTPGAVHLEMTENILECSSVIASTSSRISPINILPVSADILERTIRAAVEQHLFDLQSSIDQDLKNLQEQRVECNTEAGHISCEGKEKNNQDDLSEHNVKTTEDSRDCLKTITCTDSKNEVLCPEPGRLNICSYQEDIEQAPDILLELINESTETDSFIDEENNVKSKRQENELFDGERIASLSALDSDDKICDLNANSEAEVQGTGSTSSDDGTVCIQIPNLELKSISDDNCEEPFPAFKSWQEDCESGEAQLSPQAGRMNSPLEDDLHPILSHRCLDFGQSQRFLHDPESYDSSKALSFVRTCRASFSSNDDNKCDKTPYQLAKKLQKKIKQCEEQFEKENNTKPAYSDIAANPKVIKWMTDLTKLRKQIKDSKHKSSDGEVVPQTRPRSNTLPKSFGSSLDHNDEEDDEESLVERKPTQEDTLELILKKLKEKRAERGLPEEMKKMTKDNLAEEKTSLQKSLLYYESLHGRPVTREERQVVKPLYDRYRLVKQMLTRASITPILGSPSTKRRGQMLQPIIEGETAHFFEEIKEEEEETITVSSEMNDSLKPAVQPESVSSQVESAEPDAVEHQDKITMDNRLSNTRASSMPELLEQLWKARAEKKKLRKTLREFEEEFYQQNGRNVQKEDRTPMLEEYREYKKIKAKLRLLEVLISKQDSSKSI
ncbi:protein FAM13B [Microcaecilia unicolor]|uniref:Protein FAM13B n=1 Tax=Microcaecilia unicolor TaxID=1415580 RepID=A0A6P7YR46_9AMPH|nr:protein FAM13B [Microcaecilia unicolor]XP_030067207.1 protein FAM13B [Microcaecilia unicolor]XP_030067208.1 protein FAM13B [Microcaecilia unicolor]XP_030067209.1 protein FAM13B [Microcaecilia unicolor]